MTLEGWANAIVDDPCVCQPAQPPGRHVGACSRCTAAYLRGLLRERVRRALLGVFVGVASGVLAALAIRTFGL